MAKILLWPDLYREHGHWLPAVNLGRSLRVAGHTVDYMGIADCEGLMAPYMRAGSTFHKILEDVYPLGHSLENNLEPIGQRWKPAHLLPIVTGNKLDFIFGAPSGPPSPLRPNLLVSGYFNSLETLLIHYRYGIPFVTLTTYLRHPAEDPASFALMKLLYMQKPLMRKLIGGVTGDPDMAPEDFVKPLNPADPLGHPEIIPCPADFDFKDRDWKHRAGTSYVEPMVLRTALDGSDAIENSPTLYRPIPSDKKIIFASSGSQVSDYEDRARHFFRNLIEMMKTGGLTDYHLVLAMGEKLLVEFRAAYGLDTNVNSSKLPSNVTLADWVSQQELLDKTKVVFMHGGLATIKEAVWFKVPIVIIPHGKDQMENALRIERAGIGLMPESRTQSPLELKRLMTMATGSQSIQTRLAGFQTLFQSLDASKPSLAIINSVLP
jgi:UDP:flavonoid glycosyltransferase YjiC (YdhE family)